MRVDLAVPDHTTLSRRSAKLEVSPARQAKSGPSDLIIDSSGLAIVGEGEWAAANMPGMGAAAGGSYISALARLEGSWRRS